MGAQARQIHKGLRRPNIQSQTHSGHSPFTGEAKAASPQQIERTSPMAKITFKGNPANTSGNLPKVGSTVTDFHLVKSDLSEVGLAAYAGKKKVLNIFPSIDTGTCAMSVRKFNERAAGLTNTVVLCISKDLPFAQKRFCGAEGITSVETLSAFRSTFAQDYGLELLDTPLKGLCSRAVLVLDENNKVIYAEQVADIVNEPNYQSALATIS
jgi:thioredoxin-dependent peroxiredoxin